jgi:biopolymer transport protein ExbB
MTPRSFLRGMHLCIPLAALIFAVLAGEAAFAQTPLPAEPPALPDMSPSAGAVAGHISTSVATAEHLPRDLSPWVMFTSADIVVKAVMVGLAFASLVTWTVWLAKAVELAFARRRIGQGYALICASETLGEAADRSGGRRGVVSGMIDLALLEQRLSSGISDKGGIKERVGSRLEGLVVAAGRDMNKGTGVVATIGATAPFVGLFGTVWGIMNSFIGISESQTTNLAVVAPGIAEALLATAIGLVAAIPAVIIYNQLARQIGSYKAALGESAAEILRLVSRDLDRAGTPARVRAAQ